MRQLIRLSRRINDLSIAGTAIVKSQRRHDPVVGGVAPVGLRYEGHAMPRELSEYIGTHDVHVSIWHAQGRLKCFVYPR